MRLTAGNERIARAVRRSTTGVVALITITLLLVFGLDRTTGGAPLQHLYYVPIILAAFRLGRSGGAIAAVASIVLYHMANPHLLTFRYEEQDLVQMALFLTVGMVTAKLAHDADRLRHLALTDDLTGLHNLRSFEAELARLVRVSGETQAPLGMLVLDLDRLKSLNDQHGHLTGAEAVRTVGRVIGERLPRVAVACRYGGDEFAIAIPQCSPERAREVAEQLCQAVHELAPVLAGRPFARGTLSISVGGACGVVDGGEELFQAADAALYRAKASGRNRAWIEDSGTAAHRFLLRQAVDGSKAPHQIHRVDSHDPV